LESVGRQGREGRGQSCVGKKRDATKNPKKAAAEGRPDARVERGATVAAERATGAGTYSYGSTWQTASFRSLRAPARLERESGRVRPAPLCRSRREEKFGCLFTVFCDYLKCSISSIAQSARFQCQIMVNTSFPRCPKNEHREAWAGSPLCARAHDTVARRSGPPTRREGRRVRRVARGAAVGWGAGWWSFGPAFAAFRSSLK
jgi:hypothetical protein